MKSKKTKAMTTDDLPSVVNRETPTETPVSDGLVEIQFHQGMGINGVKQDSDGKAKLEKEKASYIVKVRRLAKYI